MQANAVVPECTNSDQCVQQEEAEVTFFWRTSKPTRHTDGFSTASQGDYRMCMLTLMTPGSSAFRIIPASKTMHNEQSEPNPYGREKSEEDLVPSYGARTVFNQGWCSKQN